MSNSINYSELLASRIITLTPSNPPILSVHQSLLVRNSSFFRACTEGSFAESQSDAISLPEEDSETVAAFVQYMYTKDYPSPEPEKQKLKEYKGPNEEDYKNKEEWLQVMSLMTVDNNDFRKITRKKEFYSRANVLLFQAKLYCAAKKYDIPGLANTSLSRFAKALMTMAKEEYIYAPDIAALVTFVYDNDKFAEGDVIRTLVSKCVALNLAKLRKGFRYEVIQDLVTGGGMFAWDVLESLEANDFTEAQKIEVLESVMVVWKSKEASKGSWGIKSFWGRDSKADISHGR